MGKKTALRIRQKISRTHKTKGSRKLIWTHHSRQTGPELEQDLPLLSFLIEDVEPRATLQGAESTEVGERREIEVLRLCHGETPDEEVKKAGVVHVYVGIGWREMVSETFRVQGGVAPPLRPGGHWRVSLPPRPLRPRSCPPSLPPSAPQRTQRPGVVAAAAAPRVALGKCVLVFPFTTVCTIDYVVVNDEYNCNYS